MATEIQWEGLQELIAAIKRNPNKVGNEAKTFFVRGMAVYKRGIINTPWRVGGSGGGAPVSNDPRYPRKYQRQRSGNLRDSHVTTISALEAKIGPNLGLAPYAVFVHEGTGRMRARPWLNWVQDKNAGEIEKLQHSFIDNIIRDLAN